MSKVCNKQGYIIHVYILQLFRATSLFIKDFATIIKMDMEKRHFLLFVRLLLLRYKDVIHWSVVYGLKHGRQINKRMLLVENKIK